MVERGRAWFWFVIGLAAIVAALRGNHSGDAWSHRRAPMGVWTIDAVLAVAILLELWKSRPLWPFPAMLGVFVGLQAGMGWATGDTFAAVARAAGAPL